MDQSPSSHNRKSHRAPVLLKADLIVGGRGYTVRLRNLSEEGALVESEDFPPEGVDAVFERNDLRVRSTLVWVHGRYAGIKFERPIKAEDVLRHVPKPQRAQQPEFKRPGLACRPLSQAERKLVERWMTQSPVGKPGD